MCSRMHSEFSGKVREQCSGITGSTTESLSRGEEKKKLLQNMQIYLMPNTQTLHQMLLYIMVTVFCFWFSSLPLCPFKLGTAGTVWPVKCSADHLQRESRTKCQIFHITLCSFTHVYISALAKFFYHLLQQISETVTLFSLSLKASVCSFDCVVQS